MPGERIGAYSTYHCRILRMIIVIRISLLDYPQVGSVPLPYGLPASRSSYAVGLSVYWCREPSCWKHWHRSGWSRRRSCRRQPDRPERIAERSAFYSSGREPCRICLSITLHHFFRLLHVLNRSPPDSTPYLSASLLERIFQRLYQLAARDARLNRVFLSGPKYHG